MAAKKKNEDLNQAISELRKASKTVKLSSMDAKTRTAYDEEGLVKRTKRRLTELWGGGNTYLPKSGQTEATTDVERALQQQGITSKQMPSDVAKRKKKVK